MRIFVVIVAATTIVLSPSLGGADLRPSMKEHLLDFHNTIRADVARGLAPASIRGLHRQQAANLRVLEWWDDVADAADDLAEKACKLGPAADTANTSIGVLRLPTVQWRARRPKGATLATLLYAATNVSDAAKPHPLLDAGLVRLGCALRTCEARERLVVCVGVSDRVVEASPNDQGYREGPPCSACPPGNSLCVNGALCATARQCRSSKSRCRCLVDAEKCLENGGASDMRNCECLCGEEGRLGLHCESSCEDERCTLPASAEDRPAACQDRAPDQRAFLAAVCRRRCGLCRQDALDSVSEPPMVPVSFYVKREGLEADEKSLRSAERQKALLWVERETVEEP